jgi:hypothetical protein
MGRRTLEISALGLLLVGSYVVARADTQPKRIKETNPPSDIVVRVETPAPVSIELPKSSGPPTWTYWLPSLIGLSGVLFGLAVAWKSSSSATSAAQRSTQANIDAALKANQATNWQKANENELKSIQDQLEKFYGPLMTRLQADHLLAQDIRNRQPETPEGYRLLRNLFNREWVDGLSAGDRNLVQAICSEHASKLAEMIIMAGSVEPLLIPYFSRAVAHFRILKLAYEGALGDKFKPFERYVYPKALDKVLILEVKRLMDRAKEIRAKPTEQLQPIPALIIPGEEKYKLDEWPDPDGRIIGSEKWLP